jgi:hypothetical protein
MDLVLLGLGCGNLGMLVNGEEEAVPLVAWFLLLTFLLLLNLRLMSAAAFPEPRGVAHVCDGAGPHWLNRWLSTTCHCVLADVDMIGSTSMDEDEDDDEEEVEEGKVAPNVTVRDNNATY